MADLNPFQLWIVDAAREVGAQLPAEIDPIGLTFEAEGRRARIQPHADDGLAVIEVAVSSLRDAARNDLARLALQLLRLNQEARFQHGWSIVIDESNRLSVTTTIALSATGGTALAEILYDGIDRAATLETVVSGLMTAAAPASRPSDIASVTAIRG